MIFLLKNMGLLGYLAVAFLVCAVLAVPSLVGSVRAKSAQRHMQDPNQAKSERIRVIYARAKARIDALHRQRQALLESYEKKANDHRVAEAKKRIEDI